MTKEASAPGTSRSGLAPVSVARGLGAVIALPVPEGDEALVAALRSRHPSARAALFERHAQHVRRVLVRVLGLDQEVPDLLHDVFLTALSSVEKLEDPRALRAWLTSIAVHAARGLIRKRSRRRFLGFVDPERLDREPGPTAAAETHEAMRALYGLLEQMPADDRIMFALRFVEGMDLHEVAEACRVSRATVSRKLQRAERTFAEGASRHEALREWLGRSSRWSP